MSIFNPLRSGSVWLQSKSDPRWNKSANCDVGGFVKPAIVNNWIKILTFKYGKPPEDLEWGYMKD